MKKCNKCNEIKTIDYFSIDKSRKDGLRYTCKICESRYNKFYYQNNTNYYINHNSHYYNNNKEYFFNVNNKSYKERKQKDPIYKFIRSLRSNIGLTFKRSCKGLFPKTSKSTEILGCSFEFFVEYIQSQFTEGMTLKNHGEWHLDHKIPISSAKNEKDIIRLNHYTNFQPLWAKENLRKGAK